MTANNIRTATSTIVRVLIDPEVPTSEVREVARLLDAALYARVRIEEAEKSQRLVLDAMTKYQVSETSARIALNAYEEDMGFAIDAIQHADTMLGEFESATRVDVEADCKRQLDELDVLVSELLGELNK